MLCSPYWCPLFYKSSLRLWRHDKFCICSPHLKGVEVFGLQKCKPDTFIGANDENTAPKPLIVSLKEPQALMLYLCLPSSRNPLCQCSRFHHPSYWSRFLSDHSYARIQSWRENLAYCSHSLQFLQGMLGHACCHQEKKHCQNCLQLLEHPYTGIPWNLKYCKYTRAKVAKFFLALTTLNVVSKDHIGSGSTKSLQNKNNLQPHPYGMSSLVPTSLIQRYWSLRMSTFSSLKRTHHVHSPLQHIGSSPRPLWSGRF